MKIKSTIAVLLMLSVGSSMAQDKFEISGTLPGAGSDKKVILNYVNIEGKNVKDSTLLKNGKFLISGMTAFGNKAYLTMMPVKKDTINRNRGADYQNFYLEKGRYKVTGTNSLANAVITGTQAQADYLEYERVVGVPHKEYKALVPAYMKARSAKDTAEVKRLSDQLKPIMARIELGLDSFIFSHPDSYVALDAVMDNRTMVIDPATFDKYYTPFSKRVMTSFTGQKLTAKYNKAKQIAIGKSVDFTQTDDKGNEFKLSSLRGKYVLVDFWASWCVPCRAENPHLLKAYNQLKSKGFEIVGISLDETKAAWLNAVKHDGMPWIQVSDLKGFKTEIAVKYGISAIPQNFLINPEGVIIAKDLRGENVNEKIAAFIK
ncbi:MAG: TlpA disulfide reductase family protein [Pedobacter sp.]|uniref:redoxin domain-containing protein n=1 Tax=Pedobacter sp. TaxID=1411316 RepID=UPI0035691A3A